MATGEPWDTIWFFEESERKRGSESYKIRRIEEEVRRIRDMIEEIRRELAECCKVLAAEIEKLDDALREEHERVSQLRMEVLLLRSMIRAKMGRRAPEGEVRGMWRDYIPPPPSQPRAHSIRGGRTTCYLGSGKIVQYGDSTDDLLTRFFKALFGLFPAQP